MNAESKNSSQTLSAHWDDELLSDETTHLLSMVLLYGVSPAISVVGVTGNIFSVFVLVKHGFHKCSNILLFSLAVADIGFLVAYNSIPNMLFSVDGGDKFLYTRNVSKLLYVLYFIFLVFDYGMALSALALPMLITLERLVTVFLPLRCKFIITPRRTWITVASVIVFHFSSVIYTCFWFRFEYSFDPTVNTSVGLIEKSHLYYQNLPGIPIFEEVVYSSKVFPVFTFIGCVAIIIKVKQLSRKREKMTSRASSTSKTTKTLLVVCFGYVLTRIIVAIPSYLPNKFSGYSMTSDTPTNIGKTTYQVFNVWLQINSSWNFLVYMAFNLHFRKTFKELFKNPCCKRQSRNQY